MLSCRTHACRRPRRPARRSGAPGAACRWPDPNARAPIATLLITVPSRLTATADTHPSWPSRQCSCRRRTGRRCPRHDEPPLANATKPIHGGLEARAVCQAGALLQEAILDHRDKRWMQGSRGVAAGRSRQGGAVGNRSQLQQPPLPRRQASSGRSEFVSEINVLQPADPQGSATVVALGYLLRYAGVRRPVQARELST